MFKIYQIHELGGEYEDRFDIIVGSYLRKERAEQELEKLNDALKKRYACHQRCLNCPAQFGCLVGKIDEIIENCDCFEPEEDDGSLVGFCKNAIYSYDENVRYEIKEVDVDDEEEE